MKITMLSITDYAGSGLKMCHSIKLYHDIEIYSMSMGNSVGKWKIPAAGMGNRGAVQNRINQSDIIHLKGDWPPTYRYGNFKLHDPIVTTVSGSLFRKKQFGGFGQYRSEQFRIAKLRTALECDLLYPEYGNVWTPYPIDSIDKPNLWQWSKVPTISHSPSNRRTKDTRFFMQVMGILAKKMQIKVVMIEGLKHNQAIAKRAQSTLFCDQFMVGFYGNSAVEAMQYGIPTACWIQIWHGSRAGRSLTAILLYQPFTTQIPGQICWSNCLQTAPAWRH